MRSRRLDLTVSILILLLLAFSIGPGLRVKSADDSGSLLAQIETVNSSSDSSTITLTEDITLADALPPIIGEITIEGAGHTISGDDKHRIFDVAGGRLTISDLTLAKGRAPEEESGGAIRLRAGAAVSIDRSIISDSKAYHGGAIAMTNDGDSLTIVDSNIVENFADEYAGAIYALRGSISISQSSFVRNRAAVVGGAIYMFGRRLTISNSTFSENYAGGFGGAIDMVSGDVTLTHVTMVRNRTSNAGGHAIARNGGRLILRNSLIVGYGQGDCEGGLTESRGNLSTDGTCSVKPGGNPRLERLAGSPAYYALKDRSPAIDAADPDHCLETDQLGTARPQAGGCDIGAFETTTGMAAEPTAVPPLVCDLTHQIIAANTNAPASGCPAGRGADTISLERDIKLFAKLPSITSTITIEGNGHTISGDERFRIFTVDGGTVTMNNVTLTEGYIENGEGGAVLVQNGAKVTISNSRIVSNFAGDGGAIAVTSPNDRLTITNSVLSDNRAKWSGGAIFKRGERVQISNSSIVNNAAGVHGGAIHASSYGRVDVINSTFIGNRAGKGGTIYTAGANTTLTHLSIIGGDLFIYDGDRTLNLRNSIVFSGINPELCRGQLTQNVGNLISDGSCNPAYSGDPMFGDRTGEPAYLPLMPGSPAINAANPAFCPATDQIGAPRPQDGGCDIGAIEMPPVVVTLSDCTVTSTHDLNFRDGPGGSRIGLVAENSTATATARTAGWFNIENEDVTGWISADYVVAAGDCG